MRPTFALPHHPRRRLAILVVALAVALVAAPTGGKVNAQGQLTLTDFDRAGREVELLARIEAGRLVSSGVTLYLGTDAANAPPSTPPATVRTQGLDPPAQVSGVQASARSDTKIGVSWSPAAKADGYLVQWRTRGQPFDAARQASVAGTNHKITGLVYSTDYRIQVIATRAGAANGPPSQPATARTDPPPAPGRVSRVRASARSDTEIGVSWSPAAKADGYLVQWRTRGQPFDAARQASVAGTNHKITGLVYSTDYRIQVIATRAGAANGPPSQPATARTDPPPAPGRVSGVQASARSDTEIGVSWSPAAKADGYLVQWTTVGQSFDEIRKARVAGTTSHTITGLEYSTEYFVRVTATRTGAANGPPSQPATARTDPPPAPGRVSGVQASARSDTEINVSWSPARNADGYLVQWTTVGQSFDEIRKARVAGTTSHTITGLEYSTEYFVRVTATRTGAANGPPSDPPATATTNAPPTPAQVSGVQASARSDTAISVSWSAVANADGYLAQWAVAGQPFDAARQASVAGTGHTITGLAYSTDYRIQVAATRAGAANGPPSDPPATATTNAPPTPAQVSGVQASARSDIEVSVSWSAAANADGYLVQWASGGQSFDDIRQTSVAETSHTITGLDYSTEYFIQVSATRTGAANGPPSDPPATATTTAAPTPAQVSSVVASALSDAEISVSWSPAANATAYVVEWRPDGDDHAADRRAVVPGTEVVIEDLQSETEYFIRVFGTRNGAANGDASAEDTAVTLESAIKSAIKRFPGGNEVAMQLSLVAFAGVLSGVRFRGRKSPQREAMILGFMCAASLILPIIGIGSLFWTGGTVLLTAAAAAAMYFLVSR